MRSKAASSLLFPPPEFRSASRAAASAGISVSDAAGLAVAVTVNGLVDAFPQGSIFVFDHDLRFLAASVHGVVDVGLSGAVLEDRTIFEVFSPEMAAVLEPFYRLTLAGGQPVAETPYGGRVFEVRYSPVRVGGVVVAGMAVTQDVTELRRRGEELRQQGEELREVSVALTVAKTRFAETARVAEANEARYRALVDHLPDTVAYIWDRDHRITVASGAAVSVRGFDGARLIGRTPDEVMTPADASLVHGLLDTGFGGRTASVEARFETTGIENLVEVVPLLAKGDGRPHEVLLVARDIGRLKDRERGLIAAEARWRAAFDGAPVGMAEVDGDSRVRWSNQALANTLGRSIQEMAGQALLDYVDPAERDEARAVATAVAGGASNTDGTERAFLTPSGDRRRVVIRSIRLDGTGEASERVLLHLVDVTEKRDQQDRLEEAQARFAALVEQSSDAIAVTDAKGILLYASPALARLAGSEAVTGVGEDLRQLIPSDHRARIDRLMASLAVDADVTTFECPLRPASGSMRHVEVTASNRLGDPAVKGIVINLRDVTERVEAAAHLAHQAMHDTLTDLPNRALLLDRLDQALARAARSGRACALMFVDLDHFKQINDVHGHAAGDQILVTVAARLNQAVRPGDSVARLGGDEFVVLVENIEDPRTAQEIAERIQSSLGEATTLAGRPVNIGCSIGIAISDRHNPDTLLREADTALYRAKGAGRNRWELYDQAMRTQALRRRAIEQLLRDAVDGNGLVVYYQPIVDLGSGVVTGTEALARIVDPDGRVVGPDEFIAIAEDCGLIIPLGAAVLRQACEQQVRWRDDRPELQRVAVNVSARQLSTPDFAARVAETLAVTGLDPEKLCIELTESVLIDAETSAQEEIFAIHALGVTLSVDDFGTGWSSLAYLRRFPFDVVKIDRSFVAGLGTDNDDTEVVKAVISLGRALGLRTVAEGVESRQQSDLLVGLGCDYAQGYLYGHPRPADSHTETT
jgi:diguanylate cyclase (GGDEF)-like protein/PAS domain S-box-containing protein